MSSGRVLVVLHAAPQYVGYEVGLQREFGWLVGCGESRCVLGVAWQEANLFRQFGCQSVRATHKKGKEARDPFRGIEGWTLERACQ